MEAILSNLIVSLSFLILELDNTACAFASVVTAPPPPLMTTVGVSMYPVPTVVTWIDDTTPSMTTAFATVPLPPPPATLTSGGVVYPAPPSSTTIEAIEYL